MSGRDKKGRAAWSWRRVLIGAGCVAGLAAAGWGCSRLLPRAEAGGTTPAQTPAATGPATPAPVPASSSDYGQRPVAFLHANVPVTREQLGEYLIARYGAEKLPLLVNKMIIEETCRENRIEVTAGEVEAELVRDWQGLGVPDEKTFVNQVLKTYKKTLYEWKEDVIRPKLLMSKLVRGRVVVTDQDLRMAYEAYFGEKIECRMVFWPKDPYAENHALREYEKIRTSDAEFDKAARAQPDTRLAARGGQLEKPIAWHTTGDEKLEREVFKLQPGEISGLIDTHEGIVVVKCDKRYPADTTKSFEAARNELYNEVFEKKVQLEIPKVFQEMQLKADVHYLLADPSRLEDPTRDTQKLLGADMPGRGKPPVPVANAH